MKNTNKYLSFDDMRVAYDRKNDTIHITSGDPVLKQEQFRLTLTRDTPVERSMRHLLSEQKLMDDPQEGLPFYSPLPTFDTETWNRFPLGVDAAGDMIVWDSSKDTHVAVTGMAGTGKSVLLNNLIFHAASHQNFWNMDMIALVPYETSAYAQLLPLAEGLGISTTFDEALSKMKSLLELIDKRYQLMGTAVDGGIKITAMLNTGRMKHSLLVVDQASLLFNTEHIPEKNLTTVIEIRETYERILRIGRPVGVHVVTSSQQLTADILSGESLNNMTLRIQTGTGQPQTSSILFGNDEGTHVRRVKGRGLIGAKNEVHHFQMFYSNVSYFDNLT